MRVRPSALMLLLAAALSLPPFAAESRAQAGGEPKLDSLRLVALLPDELPQRVSSLAFDGKKIWVMVYHGAGRHALLDPSTLTWEPSRETFKGRLREEPAHNSQSYAGLACDGESVWVAWHWRRYDIPVSQAQLLMKIEPETGKVLAEHPLPGGERARRDARTDVGRLSPLAREGQQALGD